jgi:hypothetical protein
MTKFEIWWTGTQTLKQATFNSSVIWGGAGVTNASPTYDTLASSVNIGLNNTYNFDFLFNQNVTTTTVIFLKITTSEGCYYIYGSHP